MKKGMMMLLCALLTSCAGMPGNVSTTTSKFDGERQIQVEPGWLPNGMASSLKLGGFWSEKSLDKFYIEVVYDGANLVESARVNIDGRIVDLGKGEARSFGSVRVENGLRFEVSLSLVEELLAGKHVIFQASLAGGSRAEGEFKAGTTCAKGGFQKALVQINQVKQVATK